MGRSTSAPQPTMGGVIKILFAFVVDDYNGENKKRKRNRLMSDGKEIEACLMEKRTIHSFMN